MSSKIVPPISMMSPEPNKASSSGTKLAPSKALSKESKSTKPMSSLTESLDVKSIKKCSKSNLKMLALVLSEIVNELYDSDEENEQEASSHHSAQSEQGSITSNDLYNSELYQDGQDPFA